MSLIITKHAEKRAKERLGLNKKAVQRQGELALDKGISHGQTKSRLKRWIDKEATKIGSFASDYIIYNSHLFIFRNCDENKALITMIPVPSNRMSKIKSYIK